MKVEYITPFVTGSIFVIEEILGLTPERGQLTARPELFTSQQINILCAISGEIEGQVIYGMNSGTARKLAGKLRGKQFSDITAEADVAIAEVGQRLSDSSLKLLAAEGFPTEMSSQTIIKGANIRMSKIETPTLVIPILIDGIGEIEIYVSLRVAKDSAA
ncbi:MAG: chemotaxis protein CheX [Fimbriimonadaceae bacterium]|nr:MAG: chemotaxis protein CheX [Fimbriimonadaceae bacterium]